MRHRRRAVLTALLLSLLAVAYTAGLRAATPACELRRADGWIQVYHRGDLVAEFQPGDPQYPALDEALTWQW